MKKNLIYLIIFFIFLASKTYASYKEEIINNFIKTNNLSFDFKQTIKKNAYIVLRKSIILLVKPNQRFRSRRDNQSNELALLVPISTDT